jgi:predicted ribosome quality control (RQC) complex YloA/Tae2 family protein
LATASDATRGAWQAEAERALEGVAATITRAEAVVVERAIRKAESRLERRAAAITGDLAKMAATTALAARAVHLVPVARKAKRGATELRGPDYENGGEIVLPLDPGKVPQAQLEALFARAKRMKAGREVAEARLAETRRAHETLGKIRATLAESPSLDAEEIAALRTSAKAAAPKDVAFGGPDGASPHPRGSSQKHNAFRRFRTPRGTLVLVGKGSADNDELTFRVASPHDLWLHAKDRRGAHVIVPLRKSEALPDGALVDAATLAAHFSDARDEALVDVQYTARKYVRKMKGGPGGAVVVEREKVLVLRVDRARVAQLLDGEEA